jgi:hypothetical protein
MRLIIWVSITDLTSWILPPKAIGKITLVTRLTYVNPDWTDQSFSPGIQVQLRSSSEVLLALIFDCEGHFKSFSRRVR